MNKKRRRSASKPTEDDLTRIKRLAVIAMFSDDELMEQLVLKGGNALDLVHDVSTRASVDLDFSMEHAFAGAELEDVRQRIEYRLKQVFRPAGYEVFDVRLLERPEQVTPDLADFWGGYLLEFRLSDADTFAEHGGDLNAIRRIAAPVGPNRRTRFEIDISKHEYCADKQALNFDGYTIYVYTPEMLVCEKLRAICQQMPEYTALVKKQATPRARDFLDVHDTIRKFNIDLPSRKNLELLAKVFEAKRVSQTLLRVVRGSREFHRADWPAVEASIRPGVQAHDFDYYFDFVVSLSDQLEALRDM